MPKVDVYDIKGKKVTTSTEIKKPLYAVVVFDRSSSMNCTKYSYDWMGNKYCAEVGNKWESAVNGAKTFAETLLNKVNNAQIALVGFSGNNRGDTPYSGDTPYNDAETLREFANINLDDANFGSANGGTNLQAGLLKANELLSDTSIPENAVKYVVVISDGQPTFYYDNKGYTSGNGNSTTKETYKSTIGAATTLKNQAEVFSIGYMLPSGTVYGNKTAADILTEVSSPNKEGSIIKHYVDGKPEDVANAFTNIAEEISTANAGTNAQLTDKLGNAFSFVDGNGRTSRLLMNLVLMNNGYNPVIIKKESRLKYYEALDKAHTTGDYTDFVKLVNKLEIEMLKKYLELLDDIHSKYYKLILIFSSILELLNNLVEYVLHL